MQGINVWKDMAKTQRIGNAQVKLSKELDFHVLTLYNGEPNLINGREGSTIRVLWLIVAHFLFKIKMITN